MRDEGRRHVAALQDRYRDETGIGSLKLRHNNVLGYYVEIAAAHHGRMTERFVHRQTMANAMRYATTELAELEARIARAAEQALAMELELFADLVSEVTARAADLGRAAGALAGLDVAAALAELAAERDYRRPAVDDGPGFAVRGGRHPVVEAPAADRRRAVRRQ